MVPLNSVNSTSGPSTAIMASIATSNGAPANVFSLIAISCQKQGRSAFRRE